MRKEKHEVAEKYLNAIKKYKEEKGEYPNQANLARYMNLSRARIHQVIPFLLHQGKIKKQPIIKEKQKITTKKVKFLQLIPLE